MTSNEESTGEEGLVTIRGSVTWINPYKGGARPPRDVEEEGRRTKPCTNTVLHIRPAEGPEEPPFDLDSIPLTQLRTDSDGEFEVKLAPGVYNIFRADKLGKPKWHDEAIAAATVADGGSSSGGSSMRMRFPGGPDIAENERWRRHPDCGLTVMVPEGAPEMAIMGGVVLHWVNGMERGVALPC
jgi:hypothetical protein